MELVKGIASIPAALPSFTAPDLSAVPELIGGAFSVALVALAQAAGISPSMPNPDGSRSDDNGDFRSQGYANLLGGLFQALPSGGSMSRTGVAVSAGARTVPDVPSSAVFKLLDRYARALADAGGRLVLAGVQPPLVRALEASGLGGRLGEGGVVPARSELFGALHTAVAEGHAWIAARSSCTATGCPRRPTARSAPASA
ncbi:SulP family inorganic anion transporter [Streptomyces sp. NPDC006197]|uniref:SulP family inorganic anion transporter n=1 Tax=Streptomyces sp. NPDC006197 TaxID=3156685 RepID=UPI00339F3B3F